MELPLTISTDDPDEIEELLTPVMGDLKIVPLTKKYQAEIHGRKLDRLAVFTVQANESKGFTEPPHEHVGLYLPLVGGFSATEGSRTDSFVHDIHLLRPDREFAHTLNSGSQLLAANIFARPVQDCVRKLTGSDASRALDIGNRIVVSSAAGRILARDVFRLWSELNQSGAGPGSHIRITELEDELIASFVMATETIANCRRRGEPISIERAMARAEEYLDSHLNNAVSRADLAAAAGVSIRTLSRGFLKRHDTGPMGFLKARRLYAAYRRLLAAEPGSIRVTDIALGYGFNHLGKFSVEYKQAFGESPSVTLNR